MTKRDIITGIDIGSNKIAVVVGRAQNDNSIDILGVGTAKSNGVRKGAIVDLEETISSLSAALEEAERMSGASINEAYVSIDGQHIETGMAKGVISVSKSDGDITEIDVERVVEAARSVSTPPNREIIHSIPQSFIVDGQTGIKDPVGMTGVRLEVEATMITGSTTSLKNITKSLNQAGITVIEYVFSPLATSYAVSNKEQRNVGVSIIDIGSDTTNYAIYEDTQLLGVGTIPIGASHITNDLAIGLRTSIEVAEKIKKEYSNAMPSLVKEKKLSGKKVGFDGGDVDMTLVADIIEARVNEIFILIRDNLRKINRDSLLPAGVILTGGGAAQNGITSLAKETLKLPAAIGEIATEISGMVDNVSEPQYSTSVGLIMWAIEANMSMPRPASRFNLNSLGNWDEVAEKTKKIFKNLLP